MVEINTQESSMLYECPNCKNDEIELGQNYCQICGEAIERKEE